MIHLVVNNNACFVAINIFVLEIISEMLAKDIPKHKGICINFFHSPLFHIIVDISDFSVCYHTAYLDWYTRLSVAVMR